MESLFRKAKRFKKDGRNILWGFEQDEVEGEAETGERIEEIQIHESKHQQE